MGPKEQMLLGVLRHFLTVGGGLLVEHGYMTTGQLDEGVGAAVVLIGIGWSIWDKYHQKALVAMPAPVPATGGVKP